MSKYSYFLGFVELPDGKVLSGSEWGNMLLWEGGLIKVEISRKGKKTCHQGMIEQFFLDEGELITIGVDGYVKVGICFIEMLYACQISFKQSSSFETLSSSGCALWKGNLELPHFGFSS